MLFLLLLVHCSDIIDTQLQLTKISLLSNQILFWTLKFLQLVRSNAIEREIIADLSRSQPRQPKNLRTHSKNDLIDRESFVSYTLSLVTISI